MSVTTESSDVPQYIIDTKPSLTSSAMNLTGTWHPHSMEGYDELLKTIGYGVIQIKGALLCKETIEHKDTSLEICTSVKVIFITISNTSTYTFGENNPETDPKGNTWQSKMYYSDGALVIDGVCEKKGFRNVQRRKVVGDEMIVTYEFTHPGGVVTATRHLKRHHHH